LIGAANNLAKQLGLNGAEIKAEMMKGDYENLVNVFDKHFGHFVTLYR
jgi:N-acetyl-anhydromuramyl-L-alanine amidase AmpD